MTTAELTNDDLAWLSHKLNAHHAMIKKSEELTDEEKNTEIYFLVKRAMAFGLNDLISRFGYVLMKIPLTERIKGQKREVTFLFPKNITENDVDIIVKQLEIHKINSPQ